jgi:uridine kinase
MLHLSVGGESESVKDMKKIYLLILLLVPISFNQTLIPPSNDQPITRRAKDLDIEITESWDTFLGKFLSDLFKTSSSISVSAQLSTDFFQALRNNGPAARSIELKNLIRHTYFEIFKTTPNKNILIAFCEIAAQTLKRYSFSNFYTDDTGSEVSYRVREPLDLSETVITQEHIDFEELLLDVQKEDPFKEEIYSNLVDFYREMIEIYPNITRYYFHLAWALSGLGSKTDNYRSIMFMEALSKEFAPIPFYISRFQTALALKNNRHRGGFLVDWSSYRSETLLERREDTQKMVFNHALKYAKQFPEFFQREDGNWIDPYNEDKSYSSEFLNSVRLYEARAKDIIKSNGVEIYGFWKESRLQFLAMVPETGEIAGFRMRKNHSGLYEVAIDTFYKASDITIAKLREQAQVPFGEKHLVLLIGQDGEIMTPKDDGSDPYRTHRGPEQVAEFTGFALTKSIYQDGFDLIDKRLLSQEGRGLLIIGGVTAAGKSPGTEFLSGHIESRGRRVVILPMDRYYNNRDTMPIIEYTDATGKTHIMRDFDNPQALNQERFRDDLIRLLNGEEVDLPRYDFESGISYSSSGEKLQLGEGDIIVIEGIHALNLAFTGSVPEDISTASIFIDASRDIRLVRRVLRDIESRGYSALVTINQWPIVAMAEDKYIYPLKPNADVIIDTTPDQESWLNSNSYQRFKVTLEDAYVEALKAGDARSIINALRLFTDFGLKVPAVIQNGIPSQ